MAMAKIAKLCYCLHMPSKGDFHECLPNSQSREAQRSTMLDDLRHELLIGSQQLDSKKSKPFDKTLVEKIKARDRQKMG
ncbi:hypothetical protein KAI87_10160 [Myxococcota bacterium]|nr:hypothetical protein [Myxococcota bacterium]